MYVSGSAEKMPQEVASVFARDVCEKQGGMTAAEAQQYMKRMEAAGRYHVEAWS